MIKNILFDLDGVLVDAADWHFKALNKSLLDIAGYEISQEDHIKEFNGLPTRIKLATLIKKGLIPFNKTEEIFKLKQYYTIQLIATYCKPDPEKIEMLLNLSSYRKACVTNSIYQTAYEMLVRSGINYYMEYVQGNEATPFPKPNPSPYLKAMAKMGIEPSETLIVEDNEKGYISAAKSGAHVFKIETYKDLNLKTILQKIGELQ